MPVRLSWDSMPRTTPPKSGFAPNAALANSWPRSKRMLEAARRYRQRTESESKKTRYGLSQVFLKPNPAKAQHEGFKACRPRQQLPDRRHSVGAGNSSGLHGGARCLFSKHPRCALPDHPAGAEYAPDAFGAPRFGAGAFRRLCPTPLGPNAQRQTEVVPRLE